MFLRIYMQRLLAINSQMFEGIPGFEQVTALSKMEPEESESNDKSASRQLYDSMDDISEEKQAIFLPLALSAILASTFYITLTSQQSGVEQLLDTSAVNQFRQFLLGAAPWWGLISGGIVCGIFTKSEIQSLLDSPNDTDMAKDTTGAVSSILESSEAQESKNPLSISLSASAAAAILLVSVAYLPTQWLLANHILDPSTAVTFANNVQWPVQNIVNMCIAITTARALQLPKLPTILLALFGLTIYDVVAVLGTQQFTDGGNSIMEAVARAKVSAMESGSMMKNAVETAGAEAIRSNGAAAAAAAAVDVPIRSGLWAPGLWTVVLGGRVSDGLGLADVVFPCMLSTWALRYDRRHLSNPHDDDDEDDDDGAYEYSDNNGESADASICNRTREVTDTDNSKKQVSLFKASLSGFVLGCLACEIFQTGAGQPALLYLVPSMTLTILTVGLINRDLPDMWKFAP